MALNFYTNYVLNSLGQPVVNYNVAVLNSPSNDSSFPGTPLANIFYDEAGLFPMPNPISPANPVPVTQTFYGNNSVITGDSVVTTIPIITPIVGPFSIPIELGAIPQAVIINNNSNATIELQNVTPFDLNNIYLVSNTDNVNANLIVFTQLISNLPVVPTFPTGLDGLGNFSFYVASGVYDLQYYGGSLSQQLVDYGIILGSESINYGPTIVTGLVNGINKIFTLGATPLSPLDVIVTLGGSVMQQGVDYTLSGVTITFTTAPLTNSIIQAFFTITGSVIVRYGPTTVTGLVNGINKIFTLGSTPANPSNLILTLGGSILQQGLDYILTGTTISFTTAPFVNSIIQAFYTI